MEFEISNSKIEIRQPPNNTFPLLSFDLELIFQEIRKSHILEILKHILLESKIIIFSSRKLILTPIIEGLLALIFPLKYCYNYISILPNDKYSYLENQNPYIVGINSSYSEDFLLKNKIDLSNYWYLIVNLDDKENKLKFRNRTNETNCNLLINRNLNFNESLELPKHYKIKLRDTLDNLSRKEDKEQIIKNIREYFFHFMVNILYTYSNFVNHEIIKKVNNNVLFPDTQIIFKTKEFLESVAKADVNFYHEFINTRMFNDFLFRRVLSNDIKDKIETIFFEEHIIDKNNRSLFSKTVI